MDSDAETGAPPPPGAPARGELTPLLPAAAAGTAAAATYVDDIEDELDRPWPATFERGIRLLAGPVLDAGRAAEFTRSPAVGARYGRARAAPSDLRRGFRTPDAPPGAAGAVAASPGTPAWLRRGLVRMKSLDYAFGDGDVATPVPAGAGQRRREERAADARAYRQRVLGGAGTGGTGRSSSTGHLAPSLEAADAAATASPGLRRERQRDRQMKEEQRSERRAMEEEDDKSSFWQCTFNMANILMVSCSLRADQLRKGWLWKNGDTAGASLILQKKAGGRQDALFFV